MAARLIPFLPPAQRRRLRTAGGPFSGFRAGVALLFLALTVLPGTTMAAEPVKLLGISHELHDKGLLLTITATAPVAFKASESTEPPQVVLVLPDVLPAQDALLPPLPENPLAGMTLESNTSSVPPQTTLRISPKIASAYKVYGDGNHVLLQVSPLEVSPPAGKEPAAPAEGKQGKSAPLVRSVEVIKSAGQTLVRLTADGPLANYSPHVLAKKGTAPPRLYLDLPNSTGVKLPPRQEVGGLVSSVRVAQRPEGLRVVLDASGDTPFPYTLSSKGGILDIIIPEEEGSETPSTVITPAEKPPLLPAMGVGKPAVPTPAIPAIPAPAPPSADSLAESTPRTVVATPPRATALRDKFNMTGADKQRISVDFYKIDLHNVFRLIREISGSNIVVHEDVKGTLTLALHDVPWDFALDIVLNLKGLHKEERDNTIVILPKDSKGFTWPERGGGNLEFEADTNLVVQEAIIIQQQQNIPKEQLEARPYIQQGRQAEQREEFENAMEAYDKALVLWPKNAALATHMANISLVRLGQNAKALHLARQALAAEPGNHAAALNAGIAAANMRRMQEAEQYFDQSVSGEAPSREALLSYSVFAEENERYDAAVLLLKKYTELHGSSMESLIAQARIQDKLNQPEQATKIYRSILHGGFRLPPDLEQYIQARVKAHQSDPSTK